MVEYFVFLTCTVSFKKQKPAFFQGHLISTERMVKFVLRLFQEKRRFDLATTIRETKIKTV